MSWGRSWVQISEQVPEDVRGVDLQAKTSDPVKTYSGGMKRRLSTAIALIGRSKGDAMFLDEPSTGLDPLNRSWWR